MSLKLLVDQRIDLLIGTNKLFRLSFLPSVFQRKFDSYRSDASLFKHGTLTFMNLTNSIAPLRLKT